MASSSTTATEFNYENILNQFCQRKSINLEMDFHIVNSENGKGFTKPGDDSGKIYPFMTGCWVKFNFEGQKFAAKGVGIGKKNAKIGASRRVLTSLFIHLYKGNSKLQPIDYGLTKQDLIWYNAREKQHFDFSVIPQSKFHYEPHQKRKLFNQVTSPPVEIDSQARASASDWTSDQPSNRRDASSLAERPKRKSLENGDQRKSSFEEIARSARPDHNRSGAQHSSPKKNESSNSRSQQNARPAIGHNPYDSAHKGELSFSDASLDSDAQSIYTDHSFESFDGGCHNRHYRPNHRERGRSNNQKRDRSDRSPNGANRFDSNGPTKAAGSETRSESVGEFEEAIGYLSRNQEIIENLLAASSQTYADLLDQLTNSLPKLKCVRGKSRTDDNLLHSSRLLYKSTCIYLAFDQTPEMCLKKLIYCIKLQFARAKN